MAKRIFYADAKIDFGGYDPKDAKVVTLDDNHDRIAFTTDFPAPTLEMDELEIYENIEPITELIPEEEISIDESDKIVNKCNNASWYFINVED